MEMRRLRFGRLAAAVLMVAASLLPTVYLDKKYELGAQTIRVKPYEKQDDTPYIKIGVYASLTGYASLLGRMGNRGSGWLSRTSTEAVGLTEKRSA